MVNRHIVWLRMSLPPKKKLTPIMREKKYRRLKPNLTTKQAVGLNIDFSYARTTSIHPMKIVKCVLLAVVRGTRKTTCLI